MARAPQIISPLDSCLPYGARWINDDARFKIGMMARQTGKSFYSTFEAVRDCRERKTMWVILSAGERQSLETMLKARDHDAAFRVATAGYEESRDGSETLLKQAEMRWPNGSRLIGIPANPATARGYSANLLLDEFAFHEDPDAIWRAIYPSISNPLKGIFKIRIVSTPNGRGNKFADLWEKGEGWSKHHVDIYEAVKEGLPVNIEELKRGLDDPEGWAQEYECQFIDSSSVLLPYELIATCENVAATTACPLEFFRTGGNPVFCGIDFGRSRDLTVCWTAEMTGNGFLMTREVLELSKVSTPDQLEILRPRLERATRVCLDYTGNGTGLGDLMVAPKEGWGEYKPTEHKFGKIELCKFTNQLKTEIFPALRVAFEKKLIGVPATRNIREDLHSVCRVALTGGGVTYRAPHTDNSHADRTTAAALLVRAATGAEAGIGAAVG